MHPILGGESYIRTLGISMAESNRDLHDIAVRCHTIIDALSAAGMLEGMEHEFRIAVSEAAKKNNLVGLRHAIRDLEEAALQDLSPSQRFDLEERLNGESLAEAMDREAMLVRQVLLQGEIKNDEEWSLTERWLQHGESAHEIEFESTSYGEQVEMLETWMLKYVHAHSEPSSRTRYSGENTPC